MSQQSKPELQAAAERVIQWDKRRSVMAKILHYDVATAPRPDWSRESRAWSRGDPRSIPSVVVSLLAKQATRDFCEAVSSDPGAKILPPQGMISPDRMAGGHPADPLVEFPNGLILRSAHAAHYVLDQLGNPDPAQQDPLQTA